MIRGYLIIFLMLIPSCAYVEYGSLPSVIKTAFIGVDDILIDEDYFNSMEYSFIKVNIGKAGVSVFVLANIVDGKFEWVSAEGERLTTLNGKVIKLSSDPFSFSFLDLKSWKSSLNDRDNDSSFEYMLYLETPKAFLTQAARIALIREEEIARMGQPLNTMVFEEKIITNSLAWSFENKYWLDQQGMVLKTEQRIHPFLNKIISIDFYYRY